MNKQVDEKLLDVATEDTPAKGSEFMHEMKLAVAIFALIIGAVLITPFIFD